MLRDARAVYFSMFSGNPIENLRRCHRFLRLMGIQSPSNSAPAILDYLLGKLLRLGFRPEFAGRANGLALRTIALGRDVSTVGNVPSFVIRQMVNFQQTSRTPTSNVFSPPLAGESAPANFARTARLSEAAGRTRSGVPRRPDLVTGTVCAAGRSVSAYFMEA